MTFTPGSDEGRTDTFEAQTATPDRSIDTRVKEEFDDAQNVLKQAGEGLYGLGLAGIYAITKSPQAVQAVQALRNKLEGKPFTPPTPNPDNLGGLITLEPITTEEAFTRPDMTDTASEELREQKELPFRSSVSPSLYINSPDGVITPEQKKALSLIKAKMQGDLSSNEKIKQSLLKDEKIELPATYKGGPRTFREKADFFDVSAAIIGGGKEDMIDPETGEFYEYDRLASTEFGKSKKNKHRDIIFNHIRDNIGADRITREEFNRYADEQVAAEIDLRNAIRLLNLKSYAANRYVDLTPYDTKEKQLAFLNEINKAKRPPTRRKDRNTGEFTEDEESFEARTEIWKLETAPFQQYTDYKETFDYGHIISAKTGFRTGDVGMNRISNTEIEAAHNIVSRDPRTQKIIEILQEGNRERGARRDYLPSIQMMRNTSATVVEDFVKWQSSQPGAKGPNLTAILDKFMPREQHDNYLKYIQKRFNEERSLSGSLKQFLENEIGIPYEDYVKFPNRLKLKAKALYKKDQKESGNVIGKQQYAQGTKWMQEAADTFIQLHHFDKNKRLRTTKEDTQLQDIDDTPKNFQDLLDILNQE